MEESDEFEPLHTDEEYDLIEKVQKLGEYQFVRMLDDKTIVAVGDLAFTRAIYFDCDLAGFAKRFCYSDRDLCLQEFMMLVDGDTYPKGWIATRPEPEEFYAKQNNNL